jgi:hypothetical protein
MGVEDVGGLGESSRVVPRVVVAEGDVRSVGHGDPEVAADGAEVLPRRQQRDLRTARPYDIRRSIGRSVVDHDDPRPLG